MEKIIHEVLKDNEATIARLTAENERLKEGWLACDQTMECALCGWIDWPNESGETPRHSDECPLGYSTNRAEKAEAENERLRGEIGRTVEECAKVAEFHKLESRGSFTNGYHHAARDIATAIRSRSSSQTG